VLDRAIMFPQNVPHASSGHQMTNLFREVLGMISRTLQGLRHEYKVEALLARLAFGVIDVANKNQVAQAVNLSIIF
jgi:hypothetical protein